MKDILLTDLLAAGSHFGHKKEKWHPKAASFIYGVREGIHIIDLAKTRDFLRKAGEYLLSLGKEGKLVLFVSTKRQSKSVVTEAAKRAGTFFLTNRWIGGFLTNWEEVKKNIDKLNRMQKEMADGSWKKFPKHEQVQLEKEMHKLDAVYNGVKDMPRRPDAVIIGDIKREISSLREAIKIELPIVAIIDTNADPNLVDYPIPANDDAVGSIQYIVNYLADSYSEGKKMTEKNGEKVVQVEKIEKTEKKKEPPAKAEKAKEEKKEEKPSKKKTPK